MSWLWNRFNFIALVVALALAGCYEGAKHPRSGGGGPGASSGKGLGGVADKAYGYTILDVFRPEAAALVDPNCGNLPTSLAELRTNEMNMRVKSVTALLNAQSVNLRIITNEILARDCSTFSPINSRSINALPDPDLSDPNIRAKPALHVRLVLWFGDAGYPFPSQSVTTRDWADMQRLQALGIRQRLSVNHFAFVGSSRGYIWNWSRYSDSNFNFMAQVVNNLLLTEAVDDQVLKAVNASAASFADWLQQKAIGL